MTASSRIPFLDLVTPHVELENELLEVVRTALHSAGFIGGPMVERFEREFAAFCGAAHCVGAASGTDALHFAIMAAGVKPGDTVLTVPNTFIATAEAIALAGARPDFVDVDPRTYNMDPERLRTYLETRCRRQGGRLVHAQTGSPVTAIVPVHLYGQMADMDPLLALAEEYGLLLIEDACQAHGAEYYSQRRQRWLKAGTVGVTAAFSFYPGKNLGACGEAGAATTADAEMARHMRMLRDHGQSRKYYHDVVGYNGRLDALQAGILSVKLRHLAEWNQQRRAAAARYRELLAPLAGALVAPFEAEGSRAVYHLYVVQVEDRAGLQEHLAGQGIGTAIHYPVPLHLQKAYAHLGYRQGDFPVTEHAAGRIVSLPMFPQLTAQQQQRVVEAVGTFVGKPVQPLAAGSRS
jgi:dTDP-4-amino-4,6-dideoxygalactose transaminase